MWHHKNQLKLMSIDDCRLMLIGTAYSNILRLPCIAYGNFSVIKDGQKLTGHVLETFHSLEVAECENRCEANEKCKSINTKNTTGINCELNSRSTSDPRDNNLVLTQSTGWTYRSTDYLTKNVTKTSNYNFCPYFKDSI